MWSEQSRAFWVPGTVLGPPSVGEVSFSAPFARWTYSHPLTHYFALTAFVLLSFSPAYGFADYSQWAKFSPPSSLGSQEHFLHFKI